jgi:hypothetical protein
MIYKDIKVNKIEIDIQESKLSILCHIHLSDERVWTYKPKPMPDPKVFFNKALLEYTTISIMARAIQVLGEEMGK